MKRTNRLPLRRDLGLQLLTLYLAFVGLVVIATLLFEFIARRRLEADINAANLALAHAVAAETNTTMHNALETVRQLATYPEVIDMDIPGMSTIFRTLMNGRNDINLTYRLDAQGLMRFHYPIAPESTVGVDFSFRDYFQDALHSHEPLVSKGRISPTTNEPVATTVMPIWNGEHFLGLVGTNIRLQSLSDTLTSIAGEYASQAAFRILIVDASGQVIAHSNPSALLQDATAQMPEIVTAVLQQETGTRVARDQTGEEQLFSYIPIREAGWGVIVSRPTAVAFASPAAFRRGAILAAAIFLIGGGLFWLVLSRRVIRPIERLAAFSQNTGLSDDGDSPNEQELVNAMTARPDQMGVLTRSLQRMQQAIQARLNELSTLLKTSAVVVSSLDSQTVLDRILEQVAQLLDVRMSAIFALDEAQNIFRAYASRNLPQWYVEEATIDPQEPSSVTMRAIRSGEPVQVSDTESNPSFVTHRSRARRAGFRAIIAVPLKLQHVPPAALLVFHPEPRVFTPREINLLTNFANHAAMAIENAALYARSDMQLQEQTRRLESLVQSMQDGLILEDLEGRVLYANRRTEELSQMTLDNIQGTSSTLLMDQILQRARDKAAIRAEIDAALHGDGHHKINIALETADHPTYLRLKLFDVTDSQGTLIGHGRILQDITQRHEIDRMKSSLIATVSHELRTPLAAIKGYATTLLADDVQWDPASQREFLDIISVETDHLNDLVNDLLDMSRIEAGSLTVSRIACDLGQLVTQAAQHANPRPGDRLHIHLPPDLPPLYADPRRIESVLRNLIENAAKYSGDDTHIDINAERQNGSITVRVADDGPGIAPEHSLQIFNSFYRVDNGLTRKTTGAGLGLSISRGFVEAHGGKIWVEPREVGFCVSFSLPLGEWAEVP